MPLAVRMTEGKLWIDPSPKGAHRLAASLEFNYPLAHEPGVEITKPHGAPLWPARDPYGTGIATS